MDFKVKILEKNVQINLQLLSYTIQKAKLRKYKAKFILNLQDIFPQNAIDLGILKVKFIPFSTIILKYFFEKIELFVYKQADYITFHLLCSMLNIFKSVEHFNYQRAMLKFFSRTSLCLMIATTK